MVERGRYEVEPGPQPRNPAALAMMPPPNPRPRKFAGACPEWTRRDGWRKSGKGGLRVD